MGPDWRDCIVTFIDLPGVRKLAPLDSAGSALMLQLHNLASEEVPTLTAIAHSYVWNDSVLLLAFVNDTASSVVAAMKDADRFKRRVDAIKKCYAIAVRGQTFPTAPESQTPNLTVLRASSWAMANCFEIEKKLGRFRASWYVDGRIARKLQGVGPSSTHSVALFPSNRRRVVYCYKDSLWDAVDAVPQGTAKGAVGRPRSPSR